MATEENKNTPAPEEQEMEMELDGQEMEMEMELTVDPDSDKLEEMEEIVADVVKNEERKHKENQSKRGPKGPRKKDGEETPKKEKKKEPVDLADKKVFERELKKGTITAPQGRIEKTDKGDYAIYMAPELSKRTSDLKFEEVAREPKMVEAKWKFALIAAEKFGNKFVHIDDEGKEWKHEIVRFELHKPGRDKDVTEIETVSGARQKAKSVETAAKKKEETKKKEEKTEAV